jgi:integrase
VTRVILDGPLRLEAARARDLLSGTGLSILDAVRLALDHRQTVEKSKPFSLFAKEYREEIASRLSTGDLRPRAAESLRETLRRMETYFGEAILAEITPEGLTEWLSGMPLALRSKRRHCAYAHQILEAARRAGYLVANPMKEVAAFKQNGNGHEEEISILTPEETARLLRAADEEMRPLYALAAFAGIRWGEIARLDWSDIKEREIVIRAASAKTRARRVIEIPANLQAFLEPARGRSGPITSHPRSLERKRLRIQARAGLTP